MKKAFWTWGLIGLVMPVIGSLVAQVFPARVIPPSLWYIFWPAGFVGMKLAEAMEPLGQILPGSSGRLIYLTVFFGGNFLIYSLIGCGLKVWQFRHKPL